MRRVAGTTDPGYGYDLSGNMTNDALNTMTYNGESRVASSAQAGTTTTYTYDGNGLRVKKQVGSATPTVYIFSGTKVIAEYASGAAAGSPTKEYIYSGSALLATIEAGSTKYHIADHLSARVTTDSTGTILGQQGHYPFGEDWYTSSSTTKFRFTSYERDSESGSDYAMFRSHVNRLGRFSSPDPFAGSIVDPQSLNRYAYTLNDPANLIDPLGLNPWFLPASEGGTDAFIGMLLGGGEISRWGIYLGIFCSPVILPDPWNEGMNRFMGWDCGPTQGGRSGGGGGYDPRKDFRDYAVQLSNDRNMSDCEKLARLVFKAGQAFGTLAGISGLLTGLTELRPNLLGSSDPSYRVGVYTSDPNYASGFGATGFLPQYRDPGNQVRHFVGYLALGYMVGNTGRTRNRLYANEGTSDPRNPDVALGLAGLKIGSEFGHTYGHDWARLAQDIWKNICGGTTPLKLQ